MLHAVWCCTFTHTLATIRFIFTVFFTREQVKADAKHLSFLIFLSIDMDDDAEEDLSRASTPAPAEATEDSAASANIDSLPASAEGIPTYASCERPSQESTTQDRRRRRRLNNTLSRQQDFLERFQEAQNTWMEHQLRESFERERQLLTEVMQQSSRSMESLLRPLLGGMRGPYIPPSFQPTFPDRKSVV